MAPFEPPAAKTRSVSTQSLDSISCTSASVKATSSAWHWVHEQVSRASGLCGMPPVSRSELGSAPRSDSCAAGDWDDFAGDIGGAGAQVHDDFGIVLGFADAL
jgi:hypothetical protein